MTPAEISAAIQALFQETFDASILALPNDDFNAPSPESGIAWLRLTIKTAEVREGEVGRSGLGIRSGVVLVQIFSMLRSGFAAGLTLAGQVETLLRRQNISGIDFGEPYTQDSGDDGHGWYMHTVTAPFTAFVGE